MNRCLLSLEGQSWQGIEETAQGPTGEANGEERQVGGSSHYGTLLGVFCQMWGQWGACGKLGGDGARDSQRYVPDKEPCSRS